MSHQHDSVVPRLYAFTILLSSFLLFLVQPLLSKAILPWYGGTPAVWTTCLLFFQVMLLCGYGYAHLSVRWLPFRRQAVLHTTILVLACVVLPILPAARWQPTGAEDPIGLILLMLIVTVGPPFFALAGTGPLLQAWYTRLEPGKNPYAFYVMSNSGSLLALLSYPFLIERMLAHGQQAWTWSLLYVLLVLLGCGCAWLVGGRTGRSAESSRRDSGGDRIAWSTVLLWCGWATAGVVLMMAVSLQLCQNLVTVPFLWVVPLALYLLSFVITFSGPRWYPRGAMSVALILAFVALYLVIPGRIGSGQKVWFSFSSPQQILIFAACLLVITVVCHGELYRLRPAPAKLTLFYLAIATGGAIGGVWVGLLAPHFLGMSHELYIGMAFVGALYLVNLYRDPDSHLRQGRPALAWAGMIVGWFGLVGMLWYQAASLAGEAVFSRRNFFGTVSVTLHDADLPSYRRLVMRHGVTKHGAQYLQGTYQRLPVTYYSPFTGVGLAITAYGVSLGQSSPMHVGVIGLGVGTLAAYGRPGDVYRFYEINPAVVKLAQMGFDPDDPALRFSYLSDSQAKIEIVIGDARMQLAKELANDPSGHSFDILVLDAFDSGAIPVHLLTREAFELYVRHLKPDGVMAIHISNKYLDLSPVVCRLAETQEFETLVMTNKRRDFKEKPGLDCDISDRSEWVILYRNTAFAEKLHEFSQPFVASAELEVESGSRMSSKPGRVWTDDYSHVFETLRWGEPFLINRDRLR